MRRNGLAKKKDRILVIGAGSWGTAFGNYLTSNFDQVKIWVKEKEVFESIKTQSINHLFLPSKKLSKKLIPVQNLLGEVNNAQILVIAVPSQYIRDIFHRIALAKIENKVTVNLSKGFEASSLKRISQIAADVFGPGILNNWITLSGPSFAKELSEEFPTAVTLASKNNKLLKKIQMSFSSDTLRIYITEDLKGIEIGGSLKNIIAIASGMITGLGYAYNTKASLITRGIVEISRFGEKMGAKPETFWGLAGIGDLMLTSFGTLSRNFQLGEKLAKGELLEEILNNTKMVAEGIETTKAIKLLADQMSIEMPITNQVYQILFKNKPPKKALNDLMKRKLKSE